MTGRISAGRFVGEIQRRHFQRRDFADLQRPNPGVSIQPRGGDISDVRIELKRSG